MIDPLQGALWAQAIFAQGGQDGREIPILFQLFPFLLMGIAFMVILEVPRRRKEKQRQAELDAIRKNDKVITIGGIYGVVVNVKTGEDDVVLRIDEDKDVKIRVTRASIARLVSSKEEAPAS